MGPEGAESLIGPVGGGRKPVRAEADPGEKGDERDVVEDVRVLDVAGLAQKDVGELAGLGASWAIPSVGRAPGGEMSAFRTSLDLSPDFLWPVGHRFPAWKKAAAPSRARSTSIFLGLVIVLSLCVPLCRGPCSPSGTRACRASSSPARGLRGIPVLLCTCAPGDRPPDGPHRRDGRGAGRRGPEAGIFIEGTRAEGRHDRTVVAAAVAAFFAARGRERRPPQAPTSPRDRASAGPHPFRGPAPRPRRRVRLVEPEPAVRPHELRAGDGHDRGQGERARAQPRGSRRVAGSEAGGIPRHRRRRNRDGRRPRGASCTRTTSGTSTRPPSRTT